MVDMLGCFALGIVVGMAIIQFVDLFLKIREEIKKDWRKDE